MVVLEPHRLHPVVQDYFWHPTQVVERVLVTAQQGGQRLGFSEI